MPLTEVESTALAQEIPLVAQVKAEYRDADLRDWGKDINEWVVNNRKVRKEHGDLKAEYEKLKAAPRGIQPLKPDSKPEEIAEYRKVFGVPEKPDGYKVELPQDVPADALDPEEMKSFYALAHKLHLPASVVQEIGIHEAKNVAAARKFMDEQKAADSKKSAEALIQKYGDKAEERLQVAFRLIEKYGGVDLRKEFEKDWSLKDRRGNNPLLIGMLSDIGALFEEKGISGGGSGTNAVGTPDLKEVYSKSYRDGHMH